ncbi:hypothetical protein [Nocardioides astragali]|uniref:RNA-binding protein n=1 Tax=Nocardioides astragali TaxID=1776736 RepID=A0ABW2N5F8_9ACTN|nr:hypothetical protein [Nocardioides astragali]
MKLRLVGNRNAGEPPATVVHGSPDADIVVLVDAAHASMVNAVLAPVQWIPPARVITVLGPGVRLDVPGTAQVVRVGDLGTHLRSARTLLGCGEYTGIGTVAWSWARKAGADTFVSQHGALTPHAPPLPRDSTLLAWSEADGEFWRSGRSDVHHLEVGSQLLWAASEAALDVARPGADTEPITYLGQGHAAEISRARLVEAAIRFCRAHDATYRPHPSEKDKLSLVAHAGLRRAGIRFDTSGAPLATWDRPVVSVFSTGILEMASRGVDAWVDFPRPPAWLGEFWERYGMSRFGGVPTQAPPRPGVEPAQQIARILLEAAA